VQVLSILSECCNLNMYIHLHKYTEIITKLHTVELRAVTAQPGKVSLFAAYTKKKKEMCYTYGFLFALHLVALVCLSSPPSAAAAAAAAAATATTPTTISSAAANKHQLLMHHSHHNHHHNHHEHQGKEEVEDEEEKSSNKNTKVSEDVVVSY